MPPSLPVFLQTLETPAQEVGHSDQGLGTMPGAECLGVGTQTLRKPGACPWDALNPLHSPPTHSQGSRGLYQVGNGLGYAGRGRWHRPLAFSSLAFP